MKKLMREFDLRERAEIVFIAEKCSRTMKAQPLIDYFVKSFQTKFENNGTTITDSIINKYYPDCNEVMRETLHRILLDYTFSFEHISRGITREELLEYFQNFFIFHNSANENTCAVDDYFNEWFDACVGEGIMPPLKKSEGSKLKLKEEFPQINKKSRFYINCKRQRKSEAKICQDCPFRNEIEKQEKLWH